MGLVQARRGARRSRLELCEANRERRFKEPLLLHLLRRIRSMTDLLKKAFKGASRIPEHEQDALADLIFAAIKSEELDHDPEEFRRLLEEARDDARAGRIERDSLELDWTPPRHK